MYSQKLANMSEEERQKEINRLKNQNRGRVVKTTSIDFFLNCETMDLEALENERLNELAEM